MNGAATSPSRHLPTSTPAPQQAIARLTAVTENLGFASQAEADGKRHQLYLRHCPFREVAQQHQDYVAMIKG